MVTRVLLKTTIPSTADDWHVGRFSRLAAHLSSVRGEDGAIAFEVTLRDREVDAAGDDRDLAAAAAGAFDQVWLFAVDVTGALTVEDAANINRFRNRGGGLLTTRDHQDLGACLSKLDGIGAAQHFQSVNPEADAARQAPDDLETPTITWPNYHSGANGDAQSITVIAPLHPLMRRASGEALRWLPAHPHEGAVGAPAALGDDARVVAEGTSRTTGVRFGLCVAVDAPGRGRAVADSSFHHFCDFNWDPALGAPSFVTETPVDAIVRDPDKRSDALRYAENIALWLARSI